MICLPFKQFLFLILSFQSDSLIIKRMYPILQIQVIRFNKMNEDYKQKQLKWNKKIRAVALKKSFFWK